MPFVMYDEVRNKKKKVVSITGVMVITDSDRPEKIYPDYVDEYGDKRDKWLNLQQFIDKYGSDFSAGRIQADPPTRTGGR